LRRKLVMPSARPLIGLCNRYFSVCLGRRFRGLGGRHLSHPATSACSLHVGSHFRYNGNYVRQTEKARPAGDRFLLYAHSSRSSRRLRLRVARSASLQDASRGAHCRLRVHRWFLQSAPKTLSARVSVTHEVREPICREVPRTRRIRACRRAPAGVSGR
jgi:hypothetical protein